MPLLLAGATSVDWTAPAPTTAPSVDSDSEVLARRRFDLSALKLARSTTVQPMAEISILPLMRPLPGKGNQEVEEMGFDFSPDEALVQIFSEHRMDQLESIEFVSGNVLEVVGPPAVLEEFAALVKLVEKTVFDSTPVRVVRFEDSGDGPSGIVSIDALDQHVARAGELRSRRTMQLLPGSLNQLHDVVEHDVIIGVDIQIAQGAAVSDTVVQQLSSGTSLWAMATRNGRGVQLAYALSSSRHAGSNGHTASGEFTLSTESGGMRTMTGFEWEETFGLLGGVAAGEIELLPGEAMVLSVNAMGEGKRECVAICLPKGINVSIDGATSPIGEKHVLWAGPAGSTAIPGLRLSEFGTAKSRDTELDTNEFGNHIVSAEVFGADTRFMERVDSYTSFAEVAEIAGSVLITVPSANVNKLRECVAASFQQSASRLNVQISASADDQPLSQIGALGLTSGRTAGVSAGSERLIAVENDVEVAQFAACHDPIIKTHFEGLRASISLVQLQGGRLAYSIQGSLSTDIDESDLNIFGTDGMRKITSEMLILNDSGTKAQEPGGGWTILLGDESGKGQRVELKVRAVR